MRLGGGLLAAADSKSSQDTGNTIILLGLGVQVVFFSGFMIVTALFHFRICRRPTVKSRSTLAPWKKFILVLYLVSALIMIRSIFRMAEYAQGNNGKLLSKEIYVYLLDALLMVIVAGVFMFHHPSKLFVQEKVIDDGFSRGAYSEDIPIFRSDGYNRMA